MLVLSYIFSILPITAIGIQCYYEKQNYKQNQEKIMKNCPAGVKTCFDYICQGPPQLIYRDCGNCKNFKCPSFQSGTGCNECSGNLCNNRSATIKPPSEKFSCYRRDNYPIDRSKRMVVFKRNQKLFPGEQVGQQCKSGLHSCFNYFCIRQIGSFLASGCGDKKNCDRLQLDNEINCPAGNTNCNTCRETWCNLNPNATIPDLTSTTASATDEPITSNDTMSQSIGTTTRCPGQTTENGNDDNLGWLIVGIVGLCIGLICIIILICCFIYRRNKVGSFTIPRPTVLREPQST